MFQTFSGSSRRPRQVNLSGQNQNPFAAGSWAPTASGTQKTVENAQQERLRRQRERERLNAAKRLQRTWRGHKVRRELANSRRRLWDESVGSSGGSIASFAAHLQLFVAFFSPRRSDDRDRLESLSSGMANGGIKTFVGLPNVQPQLLRLAKQIVGTLQFSTPHISPVVLELLVSIIDVRPDIFHHISRSYYDILSSATRNLKSSSHARGMIVTALKVPLVRHGELTDSYELCLDAHSAFALYFLTVSDLDSLLGGLKDLASGVDAGLLSTALVREYTSTSAYQISAENRLWLLANFIALHRLQRRDNQESQYLRALSLQLSSSSTEIVGRIDFVDLENPQDEDEKPPLQPLPLTIKEELSSLVNQENISNLLEKFSAESAQSSAAADEDASLLASYALTLLRIFPRRGDEIRMWLYRGSMANTTGSQIPALKFFWQATIATATFSAILGDSKSALSLLRSQMRRSSNNGTLSDIMQDREWRTILLFLELYTFVLRFTDDEEFLSGNKLAFGQSEEPVSRFQQSALPIEDVKQLTIFLKNLAFTTYYNTAELTEDDQQFLDGGLGSYFGTSIGQSSRFGTNTVEGLEKHKPKRPFAGVAGMTFEYVRTIVTGIMRMLYERDSRRRFLPKDHWLMTSRFDMEGFIPAVVMEEERQHQVREEGEEDDGEDDMASSERDDLIGMARPRRALQLESLRKQQQKTARKKILAAVGPRLEILQNMPFVIPFESRVQIFRQFVFLDQTRRRAGNVDPDIWRMAMIQSQPVAGANRPSGREMLGRHHAKIKRNNLFDDAYSQFYQLGDGLKEPIQITFVDQFDTAEAGIDGGGVTKEFLTSITNEAFKTVGDSSLFVANDQNLLYPNPAALDERRELLKQASIGDSTAKGREMITDLLRRYEFLGRIVGKCLYEGILVDIGFAGFFLLKWATSGGSGPESGYRANINDLRDLDESLYQGLLKLKNYPGNVEDFSLDFTITDTVSLPGAPTQTITRELMPNGSNIAVTNENRPLYVSYVARHRLQVQPYHQTQAFLRGLGQIINPSWLSMFNQSELQTLIGGDASEIDVEDLRRNTAYGGVYQIGDDGLEHATVQLFWRVMQQLDDADRRKVLKYVTSTPRAPLLGFSQLNPRFSIRDAGSDEERLPSTSTCVNLLKLPRYSTAATLRSKLLYAVNSGAGFDLS
ncbi:hypothetical protein BP5796_00179 [Coleophoma crateriformis]|uniref:HECT-type E3 ubiquitin transferase n=1 Tax=Coleophoma crateriformis TaxID=565419 RepID=A0A3D8T792_9HELO|nr:hypothetical protein BP5796_00179 [Coleophoma crateriformis]